MEVEGRPTMAGDGSKSARDEAPLPTEAELSEQKTKNIKMKQYLYVKHAMPKTRLTHTILHENVSQDRHLEMTLSNLRHTRNKTSNILDLTRRAFAAQQERKIKKWKKEDDNRIAGMNLPSIHHQEVDKPPVTVVIYHMPEQAERTWSGGRRQQGNLPMMKVRRERTEIVSHREKTFITKFPSVVEIDQKKLEKHNSYCGKILMSKGAPRNDDRFRQLQSSLCPALLKGDETPVENLIVKSRRAKYANIFPLNSDPGVHRPPDVKVIVARRPKSVMSSKLADKPFGKGKRKFSCSTEKRKRSSKMRSEDIANSFRTEDIKKLAKEISRSSLINTHKEIHGDDSSSELSYQRAQSQEDLECTSVQK